MLYRGAEQVRQQVAFIEVFVAENDIVEFLNRAAVSAGGNAAVDKALVIDVLVRKIQRCIVAEGQSQSRIDAKTVAFVKVTVILQAFGHGVQTKRRGFAQCRIAIKAQSGLIKGVDAGLIARKILTNQAFFRYTVQGATGATPPEEQGVGAAQNLNLLQVVQGAVVLNIVTHTIDKEVSCGAAPAEYHRVAVTFTL